MYSLFCLASAVLMDSRAGGKKSRRGMLSLGETCPRRGEHLIFQPGAPQAKRAGTLAQLGTATVSILLPFQLPLCPSSQLSGKSRS